MKRVCIGIHVHAEPERLLATLSSVRAQTAQTVELLLLPDGPDDATRAVLATLGDLAQLGTAEPRGAAACFNRLAEASATEVVVLLESGAQVGPAWLDHLLAALEADPRHGLAGPTTNYSWNEQCVYWGSGDSPAEIARTAQAAALRFGGEALTLGPLYSLADFCYVVRREVINEIGAADETYGSGPCWEMDYNIRAARANWRGVWAGAAYVHRAPFTARRQSEEARYFEANKRHYQDKFCGARLRREKTDYREHCLGDACPNFAPAALIEINRPLQEKFRNHREQPKVQLDSLTLNAGEPLVSCIMPTYNRRRFVPQAVRCFLRQDYSNMELIIVDDSADSVADCLTSDPRIRYFRLEDKLSVGSKRNYACAQASGEIIVHWDDDDWYPASRVRTQVGALQAHSADLCGSSRIYYYAPGTGQAWEYHYPALEPAWVGGNTLAYRRRTWERSPFPDLQVGEDAYFVCYGGSKAVCDLSQPDLCVAMVHAGNTCHKETDGPFWRAQPGARIHQLLGDDLRVYQALFGAEAGADWPLVSCIMPTYQRRSFVPLALRCFLDQDYPNKELIIVDDGEDRVEDLIADLPGGVRYLALPSRVSIGAKRNLACEAARGEMIVHWDDDDWYAPDRLRYQVTPILTGEAEITGLENAFVLVLPGGEFWTTGPELHRQMFVGDVHGGTLAYRKELLARGLRYPELNLAEDAWLLHEAVGRGHRLLRLGNPGVFVYVRHGHNAWWECDPGRFLDPAGWARTQPPLTFPAGAIAAYQTAAASLL